MRDPGNLTHLKRALEEAEAEEVDLVVPTVKLDRLLGGNGERPHFTSEEQVIFSSVVTLAEHHGKTVIPLVVTSNDALFAIARTAQELGAREVIFGRSGTFPPDFQAESFALRWGAVEPDATAEMVVRVVSASEEHRFEI